MNIKFLTIGAGIVSAAALMAEPAAAQGRWELLGTRQVAFHVDRDVVSGRGQGRFSVIRLCVYNNAVQFRDVEVVFANGERQQLPVNAFIRPGQCTANLDLRGEARRIDRVELVYNSIPNFRGRATVNVYGLHTFGPGPGGPVGMWDTLGTRLVGFSVDRDMISGRGEGRFRALRLCVARNGVHFRHAEVHFGDGERQELAINSLVGPGQCTATLSFAGRERRIREVVMAYNTIPNFRGQALVTLQGLR